MLNPGTTPDHSATLELAAEAILVFVHDLNRPETDFLADVSVNRYPDADGDGWFGFELGRCGKRCVVAMPGLLLERTRNHPEGFGQRLYVDDNSWWWFFALSQARHALARGED